MPYFSNSVVNFGDLRYQMPFSGQEHRTSIFFWSILSEKLSSNYLTAFDVEEFCLKPN